MGEGSFRRNLQKQQNKPSSTVYNVQNVLHNSSNTSRYVQTV